MIIFLVVFETCLAAVAQLLLYHGAKKLSDAPLGLAIVLEPFRNPYIFSGLCLHGLSFFLYIYVLSRLKLNILYPITTGGAVVLVAVLSALFLKDHPTPIQAVGMGVIIVGIFMVYASR